MKRVGAFLFTLFCMLHHSEGLPYDYSATTEARHAFQYYLFSHCSVWDLKVFTFVGSICSAWLHQESLSMMEESWITPHIWLRTGHGRFTWISETSMYSLVSPINISHFVRTIQKLFTWISDMVWHRFSLASDQQRKRNRRGCCFQKIYWWSAQCRQSYC